MISNIGSPLSPGARAMKQPPSSSPKPMEPSVDCYLSEHNAESLKVGAEFGLLTSALFGGPALVGAALGGWGVAASALAYGALATQVEDTSEYPSQDSGGVLSSAVLGGACAAVGAAAGFAGAAACAGVGIGLGGLVAYITWDRDSKKE